jgi:hypothetical protein
MQPELTSLAFAFSRSEFELNVGAGLSGAELKTAETLKARYRNRPEIGQEFVANLVLHVRFIARNGISPWTALRADRCRKVPRNP